MVEIKIAWHQTKTLTRANAKARYRKTVIGFLWVILNPILMYAVQALVFKKFLKLDMPHYHIFLLGGLLPWLFINSTWDTCTGAIVNSAPLLKSFRISPLIILASAILDNFINFLASFTFLLIPTLILGQLFSNNLFLLPISIILLVLFTLFTTSILAVLHVFYRDIKYVTSFIMSIAFYLTPIFYPKSYIPENYQWILSINPIFIVIEPFRACLYDGKINEIISMQAKSLVIVMALYFITKKLWEKKKNELFLKL